MGGYREGNLGEGLKTSNVISKDVGRADIEKHCFFRTELACCLGFTDDV